MRGLKNLLTGLAGSLVAMVAANGSGAVWQTDFSSDPGWTTNDPTKLMWDSSSETFHGIQVNEEHTYAYKNIGGFDPNQSWELTFDAKINSCDWSAGLTFGLFGSSLVFSPGATLHQGVGDGGYATSLLGDVGGVNTFSPAWVTGVWYHDTMVYNATTGQLTLDVTELTTGNHFASLSLDNQSFPSDVTYLGVTRTHAGAGTDLLATVDYNLDNVVLSQAVPEPTTLIIWSLLGGLGISIGWWRRKRAA